MVFVMEGTTSRFLSISNAVMACVALIARVNLHAAIYLLHISTQFRFWSILPGGEITAKSRVCEMQFMEDFGNAVELLGGIMDD